MTGLDLPDSSVGGVLAFHSIIHIPDEEIPAVLAGFHRVIRPGGIAMLATSATSAACCWIRPTTTRLLRS